MRISRDKNAKKLWLSQENYVEKLLKWFNMVKVKPISTPLATNFKLSLKRSPSSEKNRYDTGKVFYASTVDNLMHVMVSTRPDLVHVVAGVSRFLSNLGKEHQAVVKWILRYLRGTSKLYLCFGGGEVVLVGYMVILMRI